MVDDKRSVAVRGPGGPEDLWASTEMPVGAVSWAGRGVALRRRPRERSRRSAVVRSTRGRGARGGADLSDLDAGCSAASDLGARPQRFSR